MKFDKFMNFCYKFIAFAVCVAVAVGCVSCCFSPVTAHALSYDEIMLDTAVAFKDAAEERLVEVGTAINTDLANGNLDASTEEGKKILQAVALQTLYMQNPVMITILHALDLATQTIPDFSALAELPDTTTFSYSGATGLYTSRLDGKVHSVVGFDTFSSISNASTVFFPLAISDEFSVSFSVSRSENFDLLVSSDYTNINSNPITIGKYLSFTPGSTYQISVSDSSDYFTDRATSDVYFRSGSGYAFGTYYYTGSGSPRVLQQNLLASVSASYGLQYCFGDLGLYVSSPSQSFPTMQPWKYYNDTLLPYIYNTYGDINNTYILFPGGYQPVPTPDPTEPATFPNGGLWIGNNYDIDINFYTPTDASGQPLTDAQGETVTETYVVSDTRPTDAVFNFQIPTLPHIEKYSAESIVPDLSSFTEGIRFVFSVSTDILQESGFLPVVVAGLSLGAVAAVLMIL